MLTIQPNFTQKQNLYKPVFRGEDDFGVSKEQYDEKKHYYETQKKEWDEIINDKDASSTIKKMANVGKVISEGLLEGWGVAFFASKGAKTIKSSVLAGVNSKFVKATTETLSPLGKTIKTVVGKIGKFIIAGLNKVKDSAFVGKISTILTKVENKMNQSEVGKTIVKGIKYVSSKIKAASTYIGEKFGVLSNKAKNVSAEEVYEKASNITSKTLGAGAGATGAYSAATKIADENKAKEQAKVENNEENIAEIKDIEEDEEDV